MGACGDCFDKKYKKDTYEESKKRKFESKRKSAPKKYVISEEEKETNNIVLKKITIKEEVYTSISKKLEASTESKKIINGDFLYWSNNTKVNSIKDYSQIYLDFTMVKNLKGILKLLFLKYLSKIIIKEEIQKLNNPNTLKILQNLNKDLELINKKGCIENENYLSKDVQIILKEKEGNNIIEYAKYVDSIIKTNEIEALINIHELEQKEKINKFLNKIIKYEKYNVFFEEEFTKAQLDSVFDYSIINLVLLDNKNFLQYETAKNICSNCITKILFHGTQIDPASEIISSEFKYTRKAFFGMGIYFTDNLDYVTFYSGGKDLEDRRFNFNKIFPPDSTFTFIASEVFYDKNLFKHIRDNKYHVKGLDHFPSYEEIKEK